MQKYTLGDAFSNAQYDGDLKNAKMLNIHADPDARTIVAYAEIDKIVEYSEIQKFSEAVKTAYKLAEFGLNLEFELEEADENECVNYCIDRVVSKDVFWRAILDSCIVTCGNEKVTISLRH